MESTPQRCRDGPLRPSVTAFSEESTTVPTTPRNRNFTAAAVAVPDLSRLSRKKPLQLLEHSDGLQALLELRFEALDQEQPQIFGCSAVPSELSQNGQRMPEHLAS